MPHIHLSQLNYTFILNNFNRAWIDSSWWWLLGQIFGHIDILHLFCMYLLHMMSVLYIHGFTLKLTNWSLRWNWFHPEILPELLPVALRNQPFFAACELCAPVLLLLWLAWTCGNSFGYAAALVLSLWLLLLLLFCCSCSHYHFCWRNKGKKDCWECLREVAKDL